MESYLKIGIEFRNNSRIGLSDDKESLKAEVATGGVLWKNLFLKISQISKENTNAKSAKFLRTPILKNIWEWLLLER